MELSSLKYLLKSIDREQQSLRKVAQELGVSHTTISRWLSGSATPTLQSYQKLANYVGLPLDSLRSLGVRPVVSTPNGQNEWPEFRQYAKEKYPEELDDDFIVMVEALIEHRRKKVGESSGNRKDSLGHS